MTIPDPSHHGSSGNTVRRTIFNGPGILNLTPTAPFFINGRIWIVHEKTIVHHKTSDKFPYNL